jgi:hypothetical protein
LKAAKNSPFFIDNYAQKKGLTDFCKMKTFTFKSEKINFLNNLESTAEHPIMTMREIKKTRGKQKKDKAGYEFPRGDIKI